MPNSFQEQQQLIAQLQSVSRESGMTLKQGTAISSLGEQILPDTLLNTRYKIIDNLGSGGFSNTYLAVDTQRPGNPQCVVKQLRPVFMLKVGLLKPKFHTSDYI